MDTLSKKLLWVAFVLVLGPSVTAQEIVSKKISKTYAMTDAGKLQLENKYGNIDINGWDKNEVSVSIAIMVNHKNRETAEDLLKRINPVIRTSDGFLSISYEIADKSSGFFVKLLEKANPFDFDRSNIQIDYTVYLPRKAELKAINTFGDVIIEGWTGDLRATLEHGDLWLNENLNKADITMRYGKLRAQNISYGTLDLKNGGLDMEDSKNLRINSSGTDIDLHSITSLEMNSNKDEIKIAEVGTLYGTLKFTTLHLGQLTKSVDLTLKITDLSIDAIIYPRADIAIDQESSEITLNVTDFSHRFEATLEEGLVRLPKSFENIDSKMLDKGKKLREIKASYGKDKEGSILIIGSKGLVLIKER